MKRNPDLGRRGYSGKLSKFAKATSETFLNPLREFALDIALEEVFGDH